MKVIVLALLIPMAILAPGASEAQVAVGARFGQAEGTANYHVGEVHARVRALSMLDATAIFEIMGGTWACAASPLDALRCSYDGYSFSLGAAFALLDVKRGYLSLNAALGSFARERGGDSGTGNVDPYAGDRNLLRRLGADAELTLLGPIRVQGSVAHRRIFDHTYENAFGKYPSYTGFTAGFVVVLRKGKAN